VPGAGRKRGALASQREKAEGSSTGAFPVTTNGN